jgi:hypothetical protein
MIAVINLLPVKEGAADQVVERGELVPRPLVGGRDVDEPGLGYPDLSE